MDLIVLRGFENDLHLETFSQMIPIPQSIVNVAKYDTPKDYLQIDSGFSVAVSHIMGSNLQVNNILSLIRIIYQEKKQN